MRWIIRSSLRFRFLVVAAAAALMIFGAGQLQNARTEAFPEFAPPRVEVQTITTGLSAEETEEFVTGPLEQTLNGVPELDLIRSTTVPQLSSIELIFNKGTDLLRARQVVQERLAGVTPTLPTWAAPPVIRPPVSAVARVMQIGVTSNEMSLQQLSTIAYWKIRARLLRVPGVVNVAIWGERLQQEHVNVDLPRMKAQNVSLDEVMNATADSLDAGLLRYADFGNVIGTGGWVDTPNQRLGIRPVLPFVTPHDLARAAGQQQQRQGGAPGRRRGRGARPSASHRRRGRGQRSRPPARPGEVSRREHSEGHQGDRQCARRPAARPSRSPVRRPRLPAGELHRAVDRQPQAVADPRLAARGAGADLLPLRVAHRADQPGGDPAVPDGGVDGALPARRHDQHDDPGGARDRRRRGRGRRDHRRGEHLAASASAW